MIVKVYNETYDFEFNALDENIVINNDMAIFYTTEDLKSVIKSNSLLKGTIVIDEDEYNYAHCKVGFTLDNDILIYKIVFIFNTEFNIPGSNEDLCLTFIYEDGSEQFFQSNLTEINLNDVYPAEDGENNSCFRIINVNLSDKQFKKFYDLINSDLKSLIASFKGKTLREINNIKHIGYKFILNQMSYVDQIEIVYNYED